MKRDRITETLDVRASELSTDTECEYNQVQIADDKSRDNNLFDNILIGNIGLGCSQKKKKFN